MENQSVIAAFRHSMEPAGANTSIGLFFVLICYLSSGIGK